MDAALKLLVDGQAGRRWLAKEEAEGRKFRQTCSRTCESDCYPMSYTFQGTGPQLRSADCWTGVLLDCWRARIHGH